MGLTGSSTGAHAAAGDMIVKRKSQDDIVIALAGNPNVGKSTMFNALTGMNQHTGNWPGKTVAVAQGRAQSEKNYVFVDIPGTYSLFAHSPEEAVAREFICSNQPDGVVVVCDANCLERNLILVLQLLEVTEKVAVCVNFMDEAARKRIDIDLEILSRELGVPVIGTVAKGRHSAKRLLGLLDSMDFAAGEGHCGEPSADGAALARRAQEICARAVSFDSERAGRFDRRLDSVLTGRWLGFPLMLLLLALVFYITITGANYPSELLSRALFSLEKPLAHLLSDIGCSDWLCTMLTQGMYRVLAWVVAVMLPPMAMFFPLFTLLEDSGYLPRIAYNLDLPFKKCRACGKQALTMCMGFGCNAAGVIGCRIIDSPRERLLAILTNSLVPCNGRFPALIAILTMFFIGFSGSPASGVFSALLLTLVIVFGVLMTFALTRLLSHTLLRGVPSAFTLELPPYRMPQIGKVIVRSVFDRTLFVLSRAAAVAAPAGLVLWLMANIFIADASLLTHCADFLDPVGRFIGLDGVILLAFILGLPANEIVLPIILMGYMAQGSITQPGDLGQMREILTANGWTWVTAVCTIIFFLLHWPCSTTLITIKKETGSLGWTALAAVLPTACGVIICAAINAVCSIFM